MDDPPTPLSRRQAILDAALPVLLAHGLAGASIEEIRRRSGASVGSIYHWFPGGKEAIAAALYAEALAGYQQRVLDALAAALDARDGVQEVVRVHLRWVADHPDQARYLLAGGEFRATATGMLRELNAPFFAAVMGWLKEHEVANAPFGVLAALWLGPSQELARQWLQDDAGSPLTDHADLLARAAWTAIEQAATSMRRT